MGDTGLGIASILSGLTEGISDGMKMRREERLLREKNQYDRERDAKMDEYKERQFAIREKGARSTAEHQRQQRFEREIDQDREQRAYINELNTELRKVGEHTAKLRSQKASARARSQLPEWEKRMDELRVEVDEEKKRYQQDLRRRRAIQGNKKFSSLSPPELDKVLDLQDDLSEVAKIEDPKEKKKAYQQVSSTPFAKKAIREYDLDSGLGMADELTGMERRQSGMTDEGTSAAEMAAGFEKMGAGSQIAREHQASFQTLLALAKKINTGDPGQLDAEVQKLEGDTDVMESVTSSPAIEALWLAVKRDIDSKYRSRVKAEDESSEEVGM